MYVLIDIRAGKYVTNPGSQSSFTSKLENARIFPSRDAADGERCKESETIKSVKSIQVPLQPSDPDISNA